MTVSKAEIDGDPWVAKWTDAAGVEHNLYEADVDLMRKVADGKVETDSRFPRWVYVDERGLGHTRYTTRDQVTRVFRRLLALGVIAAGAAEHHRPRRPELSTAGNDWDRTTYHLADEAAGAAVKATR